MVLDCVIAHLTPLLLEKRSFSGTTGRGRLFHSEEAKGKDGEHVE